MGDAVKGQDAAHEGYSFDERLMRAALLCKSLSLLHDIVNTQSPLALEECRAESPEPTPERSLGTLKVAEPAPPESEEVFDLEGALMDFIGPVIDRRGEPKVSVEVAAKLTASIRFVGVRYKRNTEKSIGEITEEHLDDVKLWLYCVYNLEEMNQEVNKRLHARGILDLIRNPQSNFPLGFQKIAAAVREIFELTWVEPVESELPPKKRQKVAGGSIPKLAVEEQRLQLVPVIWAPRSHPIFGELGCMHHIGIRKRRMLAYQIDLDFKKDYRVFGHNNIVVGQSWPLLLAAYRDGAHGHRQAGIAGTTNDGAYSIIITGCALYTDLDKDQGHEIWYSAPKSAEPAGSKPDRVNAGTRTLLRSIETKKPIRVLRGCNSGWVGRPRVGIRYDGLYTAISYVEQKDRGGGGTFIRFHLTRCGNQPPIDRTRPTLEERKQFAAVKAGF